MVFSSPALHAYSNALHQITEVTGDMSLMKLQTFLGVVLMGHDRNSAEEPKTVIELSEWLRFRPSTVYQHVKELGEMDLVHTKINPDNRRQVIFYLSHRGRILAEKLEEILKGDI